MPSVLVHCTVQPDLPDHEPRYRVWVEQELFAERLWQWGQDHVLQEQIGVNAPPGRYHIRIETVPGSRGTMHTWEWCVVEGPGQVDQQGFLEIAQ